MATRDTTKWRRLVPSTGAPARDARFIDIAIFVTVMVTALAVLGGSYTYDLWVQVKRDDLELRTQREKDATLKEQLARTVNAKRTEGIFQTIPHVNPPSRNLTVVSDHVTVSWDYAGADQARYTSYGIEIRRLDDGRSEPCNKDLDYLGCGDTPKLFEASDPGGEASRIPPETNKGLRPGTYLWRVAPLPATSTLNGSDLLSNWSSFNSIYVYSDLEERIRTTRTVRVGTNFEQDSNFSRLNARGRAEGFDIALVYAIIEGCLRVTDGAHRGITYVQQVCNDYVEKATRSAPEGRVLNEHCEKAGAPAHDLGLLCVELVPVRQFGNWESALRHHEIDMFIGTLTKADAREQNGIRFTRGYLPFRTELYVLRRGRSNLLPTVSQWLTTSRRIGAIQSSTNQKLLDLLIASHRKNVNGKSRNEIIPSLYKSFPSLEEALENGDIDGALIDGTLIASPTFVSLSGLSATAAWEEYRRSYLGKSGQDNMEWIAIATMAGDADSSKPHNLLSEINKAISPNSSIMSHLIPQLQRRFWHSADSGGRKID